MPQAPRSRGAFPTDIRAGRRILSDRMCRTRKARLFLRFYHWNYGDGGNDLQMLSMFEHSYAPCKALEEAKYAANNQLGPYYEYSVARNMLETLAKQK